ncbi:tol-pal system protein YbgF [Modicisalibacter xianhensis]|uniref:Cell division coordinator CpoB n=1 Tax=Modicisalibacter xianhensis TaxID=442341 RepID=A0A4R8FR30_9GAMM|nr:tol-pal system protein YbgF [Halomonas xianhensis]TDX29011.1 tol-pal system protein YbgF [Halomonas xianhensis]
MKHGLKRLCGAGALMLPLSVWAAPVVEDLSSSGSRTFYENTQAREPTPGASLQILNQLQENQRQIQELRGQVEELRYQLEQQRKLAQERYLELEERIAAGVSQTGAAGATQSGGDPDAANAMQGSSQDGQQAYQAAFQKVQGRDFDAAIAAFNDFVQQYPNSPLRANAYYWLGELYSSRSELEPAAQAFTTVIDQYPQSNKVPDALYKLGLLKARQGQPEASKQLLTRVRQEYPESNAASMAGDFLNQSGL